MFLLVNCYGSQVQAAGFNTILGTYSFTNTFTYYGSASFRNEMKPFYWLEMTLVQKLANRIALFRFETIRNNRNV